ncbi:hypothetical protein ACFLY6_00145 [Candidatus Dependentiae bacterium]
MNRSVTRLLAAALLVSTAAIAGSKTETNRPFINTKDFRNRVESLTIFHKALAYESDKLIGGNVQVVPFYLQQKDSSRDELGKGFGVDHLQNIIFDDATGIAAAPSTNGYVDAGYLIHEEDSSTDGTAYSKLEIKPRHKAYGVNVDYCHKLDELADGLWFRVCTGLVKVEHLLGLTWASEAQVDTTHPYVSQYLDGSTETTDAADLTKLLTHGKMDGETRDESGFNDVEAMIGWNFVEKDNAKMALSVGIVIPTGNEPTAEYRFEPLYGTRHFQFGVGLTGCGTLWEKDENKFKAVFDAHYRYAFEREVKRLVGIKDTDYGFYYLLQQTGAAAATKLIPAANLLAMDLKVTPGSSFDGTAMLTFCSKWFVVDAGYNFYGCQSQKPTIKDWTDDTYYKVDKAYDTSATWATNASALQGTAINKTNLDKDIDSQMIHKVFAAAGVVTTEWDYPVTFGIGGSIEFVQGAKKQITPANYEVFGKVGISF